MRDRSPARDWTGEELRLLTDFAAACSDMLRLRIAHSGLRHREERAGAAFDRSQLLLRASVALAGTGTVDDVVGVVRHLVTGTLDPAYVDVSLVDPRDRAATPSALAARLGTPVLLPDLPAVYRIAPDAAATFDTMGWQSAASVPLPGPDGTVGALTFVWKQPYTLDAAEQAVLAALAGYVAQALHRADHLSSRENVSRVLQRAMLTDLPDAAPFQIAARYDPAARSEQVGGDWYDAVRLGPERLALVIGDVTGHDMRAAARMGRLRSKLRLLLVDREESPAELLHRLDTAGWMLGDPVTATVVLADLHPDPVGAGYRLRWSTAGHPSPLLITEAGVRELTGRNPLLGLRREVPRTGHSRPLPPGSTVLFYTDGLIETRGRAFGDRERDLRETLGAHAGTPLPQLLDLLYTRFAGTDHEDDVAMLAVRIPPSRKTGQ
ncbi:PP2C family protein-serine/threonine phosphatase [Actinoplanes sp. G11-F43]|uniref:PP2C family protein-serine/threonine phosphatase n=1 Tax=Actinoplanes sp. G11-F43 TaxID=3424130 RepID=UPI003D342396